MRLTDESSVGVVAGIFRLLIAMCLMAWPSARCCGEDAAERKPVKRTPLGRMALPRLKASHEDAQRLESSRRKLPLQEGVIDFRAILHAHAEDSSHTGGTRPEMLADAKRASVHAILLTDHYRPPRDFINDSWRGIHDGVLFVPGSEAKGFLLYPSQSVMKSMNEPTDKLIAAVTQDRGLIFLSHIEERPDHSMEGLHGMEIYNRHADAKKDPAGILGLVMKMTDPKSLAELQEAVQLYPDELLASQVTYPDDYLAKWDKEMKTRRLTGVAANDCHHNQILSVKVVNATTVKIGTNVDADDKYHSVTSTLRPGVAELAKGRQPGEVVARIDLDPYFRSFRNVSTHILAPELTEPAIRTALRNGHAYVSHDWMCDPTGFSFRLVSGTESDGSPNRTTSNVAMMGDEAKWRGGLTLVTELPVASHIRLLEGGKVIADSRGERLQHTVDHAGIYRVEAWLTLDGEERPWVYSNPIYVRE